MASTHERCHATTILVKNIHCRSCQTTILGALEDFKPVIQDVQISVMRQEIRIVHHVALDVLKVCTALRDAAFEIHSLLTMDDEKKTQIREIQFSNEDSWFEGIYHTANVPLSTPQRRSRRFSSNRNSKHIDNCEACKRERALQEKIPILSDTLRKKLPDLEAGDVGSQRLSGSFSDLDIQSTPNIHDKTLQPADSARSPGERSTVAKSSGKFEVVLSVGGMTCAACTGSVTRGLSELPYVESVSVTLMTNSARVVYNGKDHLESLVAAVGDIGFECAVERCDELIENNQLSFDSSKKLQRTVMVKVDGMFCGHCPERIVQAIQSRFPNDVDITRPPSLKEPIMIISYTPNSPILTIRDIIGAISEANEVFAATVYVSPSIEQRSQAMQRQEQWRLLRRLVISLLAAIPTLLIGVVWMSLVPASDAIRQYFNEPILSGAASRSDWALFFLATLVFVFAADIFHVRAYKEIRALWRKGSRVPLLKRFYRFGSMNMLLSAGTSVAYFSSVAILGINATSTANMTGATSTYFDSVVFLTFFILIGRWLEAYSRAKTGNAVAMLGNLRPDMVKLVTNDTISQSDGEKEEAVHDRILPIESKLLEVNDIVQIPNGSSPPTDGTIVKGIASFNESSLTGEARAVKKKIGDVVYAGSVNVGDAIHVRVDELNGTSMLDQIISVVREGQAKRAPVERVVDTITGYFVPVITLLAVITFVVWLLLGTLGALQSRNIMPQQGGWAFWSLEFAIAVFVVACPCGIGLAAPTALFVGSGLAAKHGILVRGGGEAFQEASNIDCVVFDKTGTLTEGGDLQVTDHQVLVEGTEAEAAWSITKGLEENTSHPLAQALLKLATDHASNGGIVSTSITEIPGRGISGTFTSTTGERYEARLGSEAFIADVIPNVHDNYFTNSTLTRWKSEAKSIALLAMRYCSSDSPPNPFILALIAGISDPIRSSAHQTLNTLKARNIPFYMLTGDNPTTASAVAASLSIPQDHVFAGVLPTEKAAKIRWLQDNHHHESSYQNPSSSSSSSFTRTRKPHRNAIIAFVGDGINDAPALTAANVSISLSSATDIAMHSSSFILLSPTDPLASIPVLIDLSKRVFRRVKFNFAWALVYNIVLVPVAAGCFFAVRDGRDGGGWRLGPVWGSAAMAASSVCVVLSSLALRLEEGWWRRG